MLTQDRRKMFAILKLMAKFLLMSGGPGFHPARFGIGFTGEASTWTALITFLFCQCQIIHPLCVQTGGKTQMVSHHIAIQIHFKRVLEPNLINIFKMFN